MRLENTLFDFWILRRVQTKHLILSGNSECPGERKPPERDRRGLLEPSFLVSMEVGGLRKNTGQAVSQSVSQGEVGVITTGGQSGIQGALAHPALGAGS